jgi:hypothetical protein
MGSRPGPGTPYDVPGPSWAGTDDEVLGTLPGTVVVGTVVGAVVVGVVVVVVLEVVVVGAVVVVVVVGAVVVVVVVGAVVVGGETPFRTPPTVVPDAGPPKIEEKERPALTSMRVTRPRASRNAPSVEAVAMSVTRSRLSREEPGAGRAGLFVLVTWASDA